MSDWLPFHSDTATDRRSPDGVITGVTDGHGCGRRLLLHISRSDCHRDDKQKHGEAHWSGGIEQWIQLPSRWSTARCLHCTAAFRLKVGFHQLDLTQPDTKRSKPEEGFENQFLRFSKKN